MNWFRFKNIEWGEFEIGKLFSILRGKRLITRDRKRGTIPYYSATNNNNGLTDFINNSLFVESNRIIVTTFCDSYYVEGIFTASDEISILSNNCISKYSGLFISKNYPSNKNKYAFGRKAFSERLERQIIILPVTKENEPDFSFMDAYMRQKEKKAINEYKNYILKRIKELDDYKEVIPLNEKDLGVFEIGDLFNVFTGGDLIISRIKKGNIPIISHSIENNGIADWTMPIKGKRKFNHQNTISLADRGNFYAFVQNADFYIGTRVKALELKFNNSNTHILKFLCPIINLQKVKFSYGNNATKNTEKIKLLIPQISNGIPDYKYMENYMKKLEFNKLKNYLDNKGIVD